MEQKKMRIQKFDSEWRLLEDKSYKQSSELKVGPKETHDGPIKVEFTLEDREDIELALGYMQRVSGMLPMVGKSKKEKPLKKAKDGEYDPEDVVKFIESDPKLNQDTLIKYLRDLGFIFTTRDLLECFEPFQGIIEADPDKDKYQYMVRLIKESKSNPMMDRYDPRLLVGIKIYGKRKDEISVYYNGEFKGSYIVKVPKSSSELFENQKLFIFPEYMTEKDKEKFRKEYRKMENDPAIEPTEFFIRWVKWVNMSKPLPNFENHVS